MRDEMPDSPAPGIELVAEPAYCPGGACGPIFETPLLELAFNRIRDLVRGRNATSAAQTAAAAPLPRQQKDAPHE